MKSGKDLQRGRSRLLFLWFRNVVIFGNTGVGLLPDFGFERDKDFYR